MQNNSHRPKYQFSFHKYFVRQYIIETSVILCLILIHLIIPIVHMAQKENLPQHYIYIYIYSCGKFNWLCYVGVYKYI
jgi:hypothetical protein